MKNLKKPGRNGASSIFTTLSRNLGKVESFLARENNFSMKRFSGFVRFTNGPFRQNWIKGGAVFLIAAGLGAGCGKKSEQTTSTTPSQTNAEASSQPPAAPANQPNQTPQPLTQAIQPAPQRTAAAPASGEPDLSSLNRALRSWILANRRPPKSFDDFAATAGVPIPSAPTGKKYVIGGNMHIQLVNQ